MGVVEFSEEQLSRIDHSLSQTVIQRRATAQALAMKVARMHGLTVEEMLGRRRFVHLAEARADLYRELRAKGWSFPAIGHFCGQRDHTTVMAALQPEDKRAEKALRKKIVAAMPVVKRKTAK
jgi:chromosomal replication initiation ATPase DnaA